MKPAVGKIIINLPNYYQSSRVELYVKEFNWLYFNHLGWGFKCKIGEFFPHSGVGHSETKFSEEALKPMEDHPRLTCSTHEKSTKHKKSVKEYEGNCEFFVAISRVFSILQSLCFEQNQQIFC